MKSLIFALIPAAAVPLLVAEDQVPIPPSVEQRLNDLDQEIRILQRQKELADEKTAAEAKKAAVLNVGDRGFSLTSADKAYSLRIGVYAHLDGHFFPGDDEEARPDQFRARRARLQLSGTIAEWVDYRILADFAASSPLLDAYVEGKVAGPAFRVRVGQSKAPVGLERLRAATATSFVETGYPTALVPNREAGVQLHGSIGTIAEWSFGIGNGAADGGSASSDGADEFEYQARVWLTPFAASESELTKGLGFGIGATVGEPNEGTFAQTYASVSGRALFAYAGTVTANGQRLRVAPQFFWTVGPGSLLAEYTISQTELAEGATTETASHAAWQVQLGYVLTGEFGSWRGVTPKAPFAPGNGQWGAWELVARATAINFDEDIVDSAYSTAASRFDGASTLGVGINWYLNRNLKIQVDGEITSFDESTGASVDDELLIATRLQFLL